MFLFSLMFAAAATCPKAEVKLCDGCKIEQEELDNRLKKAEETCKQISKDRCLIWFHMNSQNPPQFAFHCKQTKGVGE